MPVLSAISCGLSADVVLGADKKLLASTSQISSPSDAELLDVPRYWYDASLSFRRMTLLRIDREELKREESLLLGELQGSRAYVLYAAAKENAFWTQYAKARRASRRTGRATAQM